MPRGLALLSQVYFISQIETDAPKSARKRNLVTSFHSARKSLLDRSSINTSKQALGILQDFAMGLSQLQEVLKISRGEYIDLLKKLVNKQSNTTFSFEHPDFLCLWKPVAHYS